MSAADYSGMKVTVMGLGLNGGGLEAARYLALRGADLTVTDLRDGAALAPSIKQLEKAAGGKVRYVLGRHETSDFSGADMVIKNPGVRPESPYLAAARRIETDISLFLAESPARLCAVTGSKGKSGTASALFHVLDKARAGGLAPGAAFLGGNITVSPLSFLDRLGPDDDVVLELSSWQLGDLRLCGARRYRSTCFKPRCAIITAIMSDHQNWYGGMEPYVNDKREIYRFQGKGDVTVASCDDEWGRSFLAESPARTFPWSERPLEAGRAGGWLDGAGFARLAAGGGPLEVVPADPAVPGRHQKKNLLAAALALLDLGFQAAFIREQLGNFPGIEHRLEMFAEWEGVRFYNDSAATIPEAAAAGVEALTGEGAESGGPLVLVTGGTDKNLDFAPLAAALEKAAGKTAALILLEGTGSEKLIPLLKERGLSFEGPFDNIELAAETALETAAALQIADTAAGVKVLLSPGCTSFGMFLNEFDRGRKWKAAVLALLGESDGPGIA